MDKNVIDPKVLEERRKKKRRRNIIIGVIIAVVLLGVAAFLLIHFKVFEKLKKKDPDRPLTASVKRVEYIPKGSYQMTAAGDALIVHDENGITGIDREGKWKWNSSLSARNPAITAREGSILITDQGDRSVWAFGPDGFLWRYIADQPLISAYYSDSGSELMVLCEQDEFESSLTLLSIDGDKLTERFTRKFGTYHMLAAAETSDRSQLAVSGVYYSGGVLSGAAVFLRVSDGEVYSSLLTDNSLYLQLNYLDDGTLFAANSDSLRLLRKMPAVSGKDDNDKELWSRGGGRTMIADTASFGSGLCAVVYSEDNTSGAGGMSAFVLYDRSGKETVRTEIRGRVLGMEVCGDKAALFTDNAVFLLTRSGTVVGTSQFVEKVSGVAFLGSSSLAVDTASGMFIVDFTG
ncbi:MAG: hypothetical protein J6V14_08770 [Clostridia bacterium]|nr:hypothetical protein [Clostridia bacterium]